jgi:hypothetical protein
LPGLYNYAYGTLTLFAVLTLKFTRRQRRFHPTPMGFLALLAIKIVG